MARTLSTILTVMTILTLAALVLAMAIDPLIAPDLWPLFGPLTGSLAVLISIRLLLTVCRPKSQVAAAVLESASVQSRFSGFSPGPAKLEEPGGTHYTTSQIEDDPQQNGPEARPR